MHPIRSARALALLLVVLPLGPASAQRGAVDGDPRVDVIATPPPGGAVIGPGGAIVGPGRPGDAAGGALPGPPACGAATTDVTAAGAAPEGDVPTAVAFTPDGARVYVAHRGSRDLTVFDAATRTWLATIPLSAAPNDVAITADGAHAVTANLFDDTASIVDLALGAEVAVVPVGDQPSIVRAAPSGALAVVGNAVDQDLSVIDVAARTETMRLGDLGFVNVTAISFEPGQVTTIFGGLEFVAPTVVLHADFWNDEIELIDVAAGTVTTLPSAPDPRGVAVAPAAGTAVVSHTGGTRLVTVVDVATRSIAKTIPTGIDLRHPIALRPDGGRAVCAVSNAAVVVDLVADTVSPTIDTASINAIVDAGDGQHALCVGYQGSLIDYAGESEVAELNNAINAYAGAHSPAGPRGVLVAPHNAESLIFVNTNGAAGFQEGIVPSGPEPEADKPRRVAVSADGTRAVTTDVLSDTATVWDLTDGSVLGVVAVGDRPSGVAITPDGSQAVVANLDSTFVSVIDLATLGVTDVPTSTRNAEVAIAPDGAYAYVSVVLGDGVWRIDLAALATAGFVPAGEMGSIFFLYQQTSGVALSHDGATLVTCDSFDDTLTVIDTASWSVVATVPVGDFPVRAAFAPDDAEVYVTNKDGDSVSVVTNAGAASAQTAAIAVGDAPFEVVPAPGGTRLYVGCAGAETVDVVDLALGLAVASVPVPDDPQGLALSEDGGCLRVASGTWSVALGPKGKVAIDGAGAVTTIDAASLAVVDQVMTGEPGGGLAADACASVALVPAPFFADGAVRARFGPLATTAAYGCGVNPAGSLTVLDGAPIPGAAVVLGVSNPLGTQPAGSLPFVALATSPDPAYPCGTPVPGLGMSAPGAPGEVLLALGPGPFATLAGPAWGGPGAPAPVAIPVPAQCALLGATVYAQGALVDPTFALGSPVALTEGRELLLGR